MKILTVGDVRITGKYADRKEYNLNGDGTATVSSRKKAGFDLWKETPDFILITAIAKTVSETFTEAEPVLLIENTVTVSYYESLIPRGLTTQIVFTFEQYRAEEVFLRVDTAEVVHAVKEEEVLIGNTNKGFIKSTVRFLALPVDTRTITLKLTGA